MWLIFLGRFKVLIGKNMRVPVFPLGGLSWTRPAGGGAAHGAGGAVDAWRRVGAASVVPPPS